MSSSRRQAFVLFAGVCLGLYMLVQMWLAIDARGPAARARSLMPTVGAQVIDEPLPSEVANMVLELPPSGGTTKTMRLADLPDDTLLFLNFWATWCEPCVREIPSMLKLGREIQSPRFMMLAVSYDETWEPVTRWFNQQVGGLPREMTLARDPLADDEPKTMRFALGTRKLPETYVIRGGRIIARFVNARDWVEPTMLEYFRRLLEVR
ncbi:MAG: TlpA disulfide reductase family protein [Myxococcota bacterium]|nr:TlpA disulfide reductase family protein [Myxococcota bacterium]